mgnify:CR=1 FL=1
MNTPTQPRAALRLVTDAPSTQPPPSTARTASPALAASLAAARDALSAAMLRGGRGNTGVTAAVALLGRALRTRARADVLTLAGALASLSVEAIDAARSLSGAAVWSDRADDASQLARAAAVLLASLPRG